MHDITSSVAAMSGHNREARIFVKNQRWYPTIYDLRRGAQRRLPHFAFEYGDGGAGDDTGIKHNWAALDAVEMVPRYGVMPELPPVKVELFGRKYTAPLGVAPMGSPIVVWPGADKLFAKAAQRAGVPYTLGVRRRRHHRGDREDRARRVLVPALSLRQERSRHRLRADASARRTPACMC